MKRAKDLVPRARRERSQSQPTSLDDALASAAEVRNGKVYPGWAAGWLAAFKTHDVDLVLLADEIVRLRKIIGYTKIESDARLSQHRDYRRCKTPL